MPAKGSELAAKCQFSGEDYDNVKHHRRVNCCNFNPFYMCQKRQQRDCDPFHPLCWAVALRSILNWFLHLSALMVPNNAAVIVIAAVWRWDHNLFLHVDLIFFSLWLFWLNSILITRTRVPVNSFYCTWELNSVSIHYVHLTKLNKLLRVNTILQRKKEKS